MTLLFIRRNYDNYDLQIAMPDVIRLAYRLFYVYHPIITINRDYMFSNMCCKCNMNCE